MNKRKQHVSLPTPSATTVRNALSKTKYKRGKHPVKQLINDWILNIAICELPKNDTNYPSRFVLLLETGASQTIETLLQRSAELQFTESTIVVPNPSKDECMKINALYPNILTVPTTSHEFFNLLVNQHPELMKELKRRGWHGQFGLVWLDYCGTFVSRAGRKRQSDLRRLFRYQMISSPGIIFVTVIEMLK